MKKIILLFVVLVFYAPNALFAKADKLSNIPPANLEFINLEPQECNIACLFELLKKGRVFSFISRFGQNISNTQLLNAYYAILSGVELNSAEAIFTPINANAKIAVLIPKQSIKSYSFIVTNAILAYTASSDKAVAIKFFITKDESTLDETILALQSEGFKYVIAPITDAALPIISAQKYEKIFFYIPTLHASLAKEYNDNIVFGGIDYESQISALLEYANNKIASFGDGSRLSQLLNEQVKNFAPNAYIDVIDNKSVDLKSHLDNNKALQNASIFLNTTLLRASLLASQFRVYDLEPHAVLCTQICYDLVLFNLLRSADRAKMLVASSFGEIDDEIVAKAKILGIDLKFDRVAYPTIFGLDYIITQFLFNGTNARFNEIINNGQVAYRTHIYKVNSKGFVNITKQKR